MNRKATAVARTVRQADSEPHRHFGGKGCQKGQVVFLAPCNELVTHEFCLRYPDSVLLLEFQPFLDRSLNGYVLADGPTLQQCFEF